MTPSLKIFFAVLVLSGGLGLALIFRREKPAVSAAKPLQRKSSVSLSGGLLPRRVKQKSQQGPPTAVVVQGPRQAKWNPSAIPTWGNVVGKVDSGPRQSKTPQRYDRTTIDLVENRLSRASSSGVASRVSQTDLQPADRPLTPPTAMSPEYHQPESEVGDREPAVGASISRERPSRKASLQPPRPWRQHKIVDGDTLSSLAHDYLGRPDRYPEIFEANRKFLDSPDVLPIGAVLRIPHREEPHSFPPPTQSRSLIPVPAEAFDR